MGGITHPSWKGDAVGYSAIHNWMRKYFPKSGRCEWCGGRSRRTEYASASHDRYTRNRADWFEFCAPCHRRFDGVTGGTTHTPEARARMSEAKRGFRHTAESKQRISEDGVST